MKEINVSESAIEKLNLLVKDCPQSTDAELRKLLSIQGAILNEVGLALLISAKESRKRQTSALRLAFQALSHSREALKSAASIKVSNENPQISE